MGNPNTPDPRQAGQDQRQDQQGQRPGQQAQPDQQDGMNPQQPEIADADGDDERDEAAESDTN